MQMCGEYYTVFTFVLVALSRPSSPATSARHSTYSASIAGRTVQTKSQQPPEDQQQTQTTSTSQVRANAMFCLAFLFFTHSFPSSIICLSSMLCYVHSNSSRKFKCNHPINLMTKVTMINNSRAFITEQTQDQQQPLVCSQNRIIVIVSYIHTYNILTNIIDSWK